MLVFQSEINPESRIVGFEFSRHIVGHIQYGRVKFEFNDTFWCKHVKKNFDPESYSCP